METTHNPLESLRIMEAMVAQAKRTFSRMGFYFIVWGVLLTAAMAVTYLLQDQAAWARHGLPWGIAGVLGGVASAIHGARQKDADAAQNPMDRIVQWVWVSFVVALLLVITGFAVNGRDPGPVITILTGIPTFLTGRILRFKPLLIGGLLFWVVGLSMHFTQDDRMLALLYCVAMVAGYIVPGILLKRQEDAVRPA